MARRSCRSATPPVCIRAFCSVQDVNASLVMNRRHLVAGIDRIATWRARQREVDAGYDVAVVVSAMSGVTITGRLGASGGAAT